MNIVLILIDRIRMESPRFFVILRWIAGGLAVISWAAAWLITKGMWNPAYEEAIKELASYLGTAATGMWGTSFLPKKDSTDPNDPPPPKP